MWTSCQCAPVLSISVVYQCCAQVLCTSVVYEQHKNHWFARLPPFPPELITHGLCSEWTNTNAQKCKCTKRTPSIAMPDPFQNYTTVFPTPPFSIRKHWASVCKKGWVVVTRKRNLHKNTFQFSKCVCFLWRLASSKHSVRLASNGADVCFLSESTVQTCVFYQTQGPQPQIKHF